jgi:hypothetical protein
MAARPVVLRKFRLLVPELLSLMISANVHSLIAMRSIANCSWKWWSSQSK